MKRPKLGFLYLLTIPLLAGISPVTGIAIGGFNYTGFLWVFALVAGTLLIVSEKAFHRESRIHFPALIWLVWIGWVWLSLLWCEGLGYRNYQDAAQITMPLVVGLAASVFVRSEAQLRLLLRAFVITLPFLALLLAAEYVGLLGMDDPDGVSLAPRPLAHTVVMVACVLVAGFPPRFLTAAIGWAVCVALSVASESRMSSFALICIPILHPLQRNLLVKASVIGLVLLVGLGLFHTPAAQERFFYSGSGTVLDVLQGNFRGTGRFEAWPLILEEALKHPMLGHGVGTSRDFVPTVWFGVAHAHNDYLRVVFELGLVGLAIFLTAILWQFLDLWKRIKQTDGRVRCAFSAAWLGLCVFLVMAATGNPLVYSLSYMNLWFAVMGAAYGAAGAINEQRESNDVPLQQPELPRL